VNANQTPWTSTGETAAALAETPRFVEDLREIITRTELRRVLPAFTDELTATLFRRTTDVDNADTSGFLNLLDPHTSKREGSVPISIGIRV
jgi:hypothetical protein